jgi:hypothetical protein
METLNRFMQLHEEITIFYTVDGFIAQLTTNDGGKDVCSGFGKTVNAALVDLEHDLYKLVKSNRWADVYDMRRGC